MKKKTCLVPLILLWLVVGLATAKNKAFDDGNNQPRFTISGYVKDADDGEEMIGVNVIIKNQKGTAGTTTNFYGFYSISLEPGTYQIIFSYLGYQSAGFEVELKGNKTINIEMKKDQVSLEEVIVSSDRLDDNINLVEMSSVKLNVSEIRKIPQLLGEVDIIRSIQLLPGVTTVGEGAAGFNVRGGNVDENLILLDEAPVYNAAHVLGFFSVFNADIIKDVKLQRGGIPANYGGRLSSVLDIRQKEGNMKKFSGTGGIGAISSRLLLEGPIQKDKSSFVVSGRRSYADMFLAFSSNEEIRDNKAYFYDFNAKANYVINENNRLFLSGYFGRDVLAFGENGSFDWGNKTGTLRWNHLFNKKLFSNFTAVYADYDYSLRFNNGASNMKWTAGINNIIGKADFSWFITPDHTVDFGVHVNHYQFYPGRISFGNSQSTIEVELDPKNALENAVYFSNEHKLGDKLTVQYGLRYSMFYQFGWQDGDRKSRIYEYEEGEPKSEHTVINTRTYGRGEVIEDFYNPEPRLGIRYSLNALSSVKAGYNRMVQYIHLVSNTTAPMPIDVWTPAGTHINPAKVDQVSVGYFRNFMNNALEFSVESYYKNYQDLLDFKNGASLIFNESIETEVLSGEGRAYGLEFLLRKQKGRFTGWFAYTLARTERRVPGINNGEFYPSNYDKLHDLSVVLSYDLNNKWNISSNFSYMSGRPVTYPNSRFEYDGFVVPGYDNRSGARIPDYHRLDLSATYNVPKKEGRRWESSWNFSIYNVYARRNPFSVAFRQNQNNPTQTEAVRYAVFGVAIPSVTYNFKF